VKEEGFGDRVIELSAPGDYLFCFNNKKSFASKVIDFDITVSTEEDWSKTGPQPGALGASETLSQFQKTLSSLKSELRTMQTYQILYFIYSHTTSEPIFIDMSATLRAVTAAIPAPSKLRRNSYFISPYLKAF
jgi:emp24/gp25L/p24 family/GOLD